MTAYSRVKKIFSDGALTVEFHSVNKRHLDLHLKMSQEFLPLENSLRKMISEKVGRGNVTVTVHAHCIREQNVKVNVNTGLAKGMKEALLLLAEELDCDLDNSVDIVSFLMKEKGVFEIAQDSIDVAAYAQKMEEVCSAALQEFLKVRDEEGKLLSKELRMRLAVLESLIDTIEKNAGTAVEKQRIKLIGLFKSIISDIQESDERLVKEIALLAEKLDIAEEIARFRFHCHAFRKACDEKEAQPAGKTLEFLLQELQREANTMGNKSQDAELIALVIQVKSEIERMREQVHNVE